MAQRNTTHILGTVRLEGTSAGPWASEVASFSLRWGVWAQAQVPGLDAGRVQLNEFVTNDAAVSRSISGWTISQGWAGDSGVGNVNITDADQDAYVNALKGFLDGVVSYMSPSYKLGSIRLYNIGRDGKSGSAPSIYTPTATWQGTAAATLNPRDAVVVSLATTTRGPAGRGRLYVGPLGVSVNDGATGRLSSAAQNAMAGQMDTAVTAINNTGGVDREARVCVVHRSTLTGVQGSAEASMVNAVRVGDQIDTQTRRTNARREVYVRQPI
jgi:hypothetical protein